MNERSKRYDGVSIFLHWWVALLILAVGISSFFLKDPQQAIRTFHNSAGAVALFSVVVWIAWRKMHEELPKLTSVSVDELRLLALTNGALNVLILIVPVLGILIVLGRGDSIALGFANFSYSLNLGESNSALVVLTHNVLGKLLLAVALLHSSIALWYHFIRKNQYLRRMLPGK